MFESSLMNAQREGGTKAAAVAVGLGLDAAVIAALVLVPLCFTAALPLRPPTPDKSLPRFAPPRPVIIKMVLPPRQGAHVTYHDNTLIAPTHVAAHVARINDLDNAAAPTPGFLPTSGEKSIGNSAFAGIFGEAVATQPPRHVEAPQARRVRVSGGAEAGYIMHRVLPLYPEIARRAHVEGAVTLAAIIGADGRIQGLRMVEGNPLFAKAALEAVQQWTYKPYLLNGQPVEVDTTITVNFRLAGE